MEATDQLVRKFEAIKQQKLRHQVAEAEEKRQSKRLRSMQSELVTLMQENRVKNIPTEDGCTFVKRRSVSFKNNEENRERTRGWLVDETGDDGPFMEEVVSRKALGDHIKEMIEGGKVAEDFPEFLGVNTHPIGVINGWKQFIAKAEATVSEW